jgi:hypothetical protein
MEDIKQLEKRVKEDYLRTPVTVFKHIEALEADLKEKKVKKN